MSHEDSLDDEVKAILAKADTGDSKESNNSKKLIKKSDDNIEWETNTEESPDEEW